MTSPLRTALCALLGLGLAGCTRGADGPAALLARVREGLARREARVQSFHLAGTVAESGQEAAFELRYRSPDRLRASLIRPTALTLSYDGHRLYELRPAQKQLTVYDVKLPPEKAAVFLAGRFAPFTPEGYRAPLLPAHGVTAQTTHHPRAAEAVELRYQGQEAGQALAVTYVLRWPSLDLLLRRTEAGDSRLEVSVEEEHCDAALGLCFPGRLVQRGGGADAVTSLSTVELNVPIPADAFALEAPEGFTRAERAVVPDSTP